MRKLHGKGYPFHWGIPGICGDYVVIKLIVVTVIISRKCVSITVLITLDTCHESIGIAESESHLRSVIAYRTRCGGCDIRDISPHIFEPVFDITQESMRRDGEVQSDILIDHQALRIICRDIYRIIPDDEILGRYRKKEEEKQCG